MSDPDNDIRTRSVKRVVIAGGGTAGWMAAAAVSRVLGATLDITLVESEEIGTVGVGEATIPTLLSFHRMIDIGEQDYMAAVQGTVKLGISFENWLDVGHRYIHSFGFSGKDRETAGFQHFWLRGRSEGIASGYEDYCLELRAALGNRFAHLPRGGMNYAYHMDAALYARAYREVGLPRLRARQIALIGDVGDGLAAALRMPGIGALLRLSRLPARAAGLGELQGFLERGFEAFAGLGDAAAFLADIRRNETAVMQRLFAGDPDPFGV